MTIPEAAQLVLQAGAMAQGGDVFVLDMGKPVRIVDLARRHDQPVGPHRARRANPDGDIEIVFTGLRPAEKLFEELLIGNNVTGTEHPMIMRAMEHSLPWAAGPGVAARPARRNGTVRRARGARTADAGVASTARAALADLVWPWSRVRTATAEGKVTNLQARRITGKREPGRVGDTPN